MKKLTTEHWINQAVKTHGDLYNYSLTDYVNRSIEERFLPWELSIFTVIKTWNFQTGKEAFEQEQTILKQYSKDKYNGPKLLNSGNSELFNKNILNL